MERVYSKEARFLATLKKFFVCFSTWYPSNRKAIFLFEKIFEKSYAQIGHGTFTLLSVYGRIPRAHLLEVFVYCAYRSEQLFRYLGIAQAGHTIIECKTHIFSEV